MYNSIDMVIRIVSPTQTTFIPLDDPVLVAGYVTEDGIRFYITEDSSSFYVQESF